MIQSSSFTLSIFLILSSAVEKNLKSLSIPEQALYIVIEMYAFSKLKIVHLIFEYHIFLLQCVNMGPNITHQK